MLHLFALAADGADSWFNVSAKSYNDYWIDCKTSEVINWKDKGYQLLLDIIMVRIISFDSKKLTKIMFESKKLFKDLHFQSLEKINRIKNVNNIYFA